MHPTTLPHHALFCCICLSWAALHVVPPRRVYLRQSLQPPKAKAAPFFSALLRCGAGRVACPTGRSMSLLCGGHRCHPTPRHCRQPLKSPYRPLGPQPARASSTPVDPLVTLQDKASFTHGEMPQEPVRTHHRLSARLPLDCTGPPHRLPLLSAAAAQQVPHERLLLPQQDA